MKVKDVMTTRVLSVRQDATILEAVQLMLKNRISGLPVVDSESHLVGIVTEGDLLRRTETSTERKRPRWLEFLVGPGRLADEYVHTHGRKVAEVMTCDPLTTVEDATLDVIVDLMERRRIKRLPVLRGDKIVGIISRANLLQALASGAHQASMSAGDDNAIRQQILMEVEKDAWAPRGMINVVVHEGVADLWGTIFDERMRAGFRVIAENTPGIKVVRDHLVWIEPMSGTFIEPREEQPTLMANGSR